MAYDDNGVPIRRGIARQFTLDFDAWELLKQISPTAKSYGRYISELIRRDHVRRQEWERVRSGQPPDLVEVAGE